MIRKQKQLFYHDSKHLMYIEKKNYLMSCTTRRNSSAVGFKHERSLNDVEPRLFRIAALVVLPKLIN